jgi:RES domain-containing protein
VEIFRISKKAYASSLEGIGGILKSGRWNSKGAAIIYTANHLSLCLLEAFKDFDISIIPDDYCFAIIEISDNEVLPFDLTTLPKGWNSPHNYFISQKIGNQWLKNKKSLVLKVPSAMVPYEYNYLINPNHPSINQVKIKKIKRIIINREGYMEV